MALHWFPGHMHKALKEIKESLKQVDVLIEVLDARIPFSSENPEIVYIKYDDEEMKYIYICCDCHKNGIEPSCWHLD